MSVKGEESWGPRCWRLHERGGRRRPREGETASCAPVSISSALEACIDGRCERQMGDGARLEGEVNLRIAFAYKRGYITPLYFLL
jgi:hypothetical protein